MKEQEIDEKTSLIISMIKMAQVNDKVTQFEKMYIGMFTNALGVDGNLIARLKENIDDVPVVPPETKEEKIEYFWRILSVMKVDLESDEKEVELCIELGLALQLPEHEVRGFTDYMVKNVNKLIKLDQFEAQLAEILKDPNYQPKKGFFKRLYDLFKKKVDGLNADSAEE